MGKEAPKIRNFVKISVFWQVFRPSWVTKFGVKGDADFYMTIKNLVVPSVLSRCWLGGRKGIRPVKN